MLFDSVIYFVFLAAVVPIYWALGFRRQNVFLLAASYFFYGWWDWRFLALVAASTVADYFLALVIADQADPNKRRAALVVSLLMNFGFLGVFKYFNFFIESATDLAQALGASTFTLQMVEIALPPGISFYTFQAVAYIVDVYGKRIEPTRKLLDYALFISLFPHLIAGPIQRPDHLLPQVSRPRTLEPSRFFSGVMLILTGLFRKVVIADNCALLANAAFDGKLGPPSVVVLLIGAYAFAWQIYGDFSGYSDIARGSAQLLGFHFMVNFRQPYLAVSLSDFWRRWHISLSTWLQDYLYIRLLGGNRVGKTQRNLFLTMLIGGLWHGAQWTFVLWGAIHGAALAVERKLRGSTPPGSVSLRSRWIARVVVFHLVCLAWIYFRAPSIEAAHVMISGALVWEWDPVYLTALMFLVMFAVPMFALDLRQYSREEEYPFEQKSIRFRMAVGLSAFVVVLILGASDAGAFIYFQF